MRASRLIIPGAGGRIRAELVRVAIRSRRPGLLPGASGCYLSGRQRLRLTCGGRAFDGVRDGYGAQNQQGDDIQHGGVSLLRICPASVVRVCPSDAFRRRLRGPGLFRPASDGVGGINAFSGLRYPRFRPSNIPSQHRHSAHSFRRMTATRPGACHHIRGFPGGCAG